MSNTNKLMTILGGMVATITLVFVILSYLDSHSIIEKNKKNAPLYEYAITTFKKANVPEDLIKILPKSMWETKEKIRNEFIVEHVSGNSIRNLKLLFQADKPILKIDLSGSNLGTTIKYSKNRKEATVEKDELQPTHQVSGNVVTEGITTVNLIITAKEGNRINKESKNEISISQYLLFGFVILFALVVVGAFAWMANAAVDYAKNDENLQYISYSKENKFLALTIFSISVLPDIPFSIINLFYALCLYFLITRYKLLVDVLIKYRDS